MGIPLTGNDSVRAAVEYSPAARADGPRFADAANRGRCDGRR